MNAVTRFLARQIWPAVPASQLGPRLEDYVRHVASQQLGGSDSSAEPVLEKVGTGNNAVVRRWTNSERGTLYVRAWPWNAAKRPAAEHQTAAGLFRAAGLAVPEVLLVDDSFATMRRFRLEVVIETEAPGSPLELNRAGTSDLASDLARELATQLARLHAMTGEAWGEAWGKPWRPRNELAAPRSYWADRVTKFRRRINADTSALPAETLDRGLAILAEGLTRVPLDRPRLIHGDINSGNLFATDEGEITWIDFGTVQYGLAEQDLAQVRLRMLDAEPFDSFMAHYLSERGKRDRDGIDASKGNHIARKIDTDAIATFEMLELFERLNSRVKKQLHRKKRGANRNDARMNELAGEQKKVERQIMQVVDENSSSEG